MSDQSPKCLECDQPSAVRGLCPLHYSYWRLRVIEGLTTWAILQQIGRALPWRPGDALIVTAGKYPRAYQLQPSAAAMPRDRVCIQCGAPEECRGLCDACFKRLRAAIKSGKITPGMAEKRGMVLPAVKRRRDSDGR